VVNLDIKKSKRWTKQRVYELVLKNITYNGMFFSHPFGEACKLCKDSNTLFTCMVEWKPSKCFWCPLWNIYPESRFKSLTGSLCTSAVYKGVTLADWEKKLYKNKGALKALARKVCLGK